MGKAKAREAEEQGSGVVRLSGDVLANVRRYCEKMGRKMGVELGERQAAEAAIEAGLDALYRKAGLARDV